MIFSSKSNLMYAYVYRKFFRDAITSCQTEECRSEVADAIAKGHMKGNGAIGYLTSQSFLQHPSERQISDVFKVFTHDPHKLKYKIFRAAALSLGTMINSKCQEVGLNACRQMVSY